jgi:hypothetical protein
MNLIYEVGFGHCCGSFIIPEVLKQTLLRLLRFSKQSSLHGFTFGTYPVFPLCRKVCVQQLAICASRRFLKMAKQSEKERTAFSSFPTASQMTCTIFVAGQFFGLNNSA